MASITAPTPAEVIALTGLNILIVGNADQDELEETLEEHIETAEAEIAVSEGIGEELFDGSDWTARQVTLMHRAIAYRAAFWFLQAPYIRKVTGTHEPVLTEDSEAIERVKEEVAGSGSAFLAAVLASLTTDQDERSVTTGEIETTGEHLDYYRPLWREADLVVTE